MIKHKLCTNKLCAHEWDGDENICSWCGAKGKTIEIIRPWNMKIFNNLINALRENYK